MKRKMMAVLAAAMAAVLMAACSSGTDSTTAAADTTAAEDTTAADTSASGEEGSAEEGAAAVTGQSFTVGICQLAPHSALDAATQGFMEKLTELMEASGNEVNFKEENANGDQYACSTILNQFVSSDVDLILANATAPLQAAASATGDIPILGTSISDYGTALDDSSMSTVTGRNISGTSDLAPLDQQAEMLQEWFPDAQNVGLLYCSSEANSQYQIDVIKPILEEMGYTCTEYTFTDSNDLSSIVSQAVQNCDVIYVPTDNTAADNTGIIANAVIPAQVPVIAGEEGICAGCGVATLSISYYELGETTAQMAYDILVNGADISTMEIQYAPNLTKKYNADICSQLGLTPPDGYEAVDTSEE